MKARQPRRNATQWQALIVKHTHSGLSATEFCQREKLSYASFYQWRRKLRTKTDANSTITEPGDEARFVELTRGTVELPVPHPDDRGASHPGLVNHEAFIVELNLGNGIELRLSRSL